MRVAIIIRSTLFTAIGGDTIQAINTSRELIQAGVSVEIKHAGSFIDYSRYDLLHFFNLTRPADILVHIEKSRKPFVVSPIWIDYSEYDKFHREGIMGLIFRFIPSNTIEYLKTIARWIAGKDRLITCAYLWKGQRRCINEIVHKCSLLLPNSLLEQKKLSQYYTFAAGYEVIPNGINPSLFFSDNTIKNTHLILCVARIEGVKNQLNLIKALNNTPYTLLLIGSAAPNQLSYYRKCREMAADNIHFIDHLPQEELVQYYQRARVHILPSWFETCGLSTLEAAAMGCNVVITDKGYTREYYEDYAFYCDPASPASIRNAIEKAATASVLPNLKEKILKEYTWKRAAEKTLATYKKVLSKI